MEIHIGVKNEKMRRTRITYYVEACIQFLESENISLTEEQKLRLEENLIISAENESLAFGDECIPNPADTELEHLRRKIKQDKEDEEKRRMKEARIIGRALGVKEHNLNDVYVTSEGVFLGGGRTIQLA